MMTVFSRILLLFSFVLMLSCSNTTPEGNHLLWYTHPARYWNSQSLHLGNAYIGASFFGGVDREVFALTEGSMWTGGPFRGDWEEWGVEPGVQGVVDAIREAVMVEDFALADSLSANVYLGQNQSFGHFTSIGDLVLDMQGATVACEDYRRELDLSSSLGRVRYTREDVRFDREYFCSYPHRVLAMKFRSSQEGQVAFRLGMDVIQEDYRTVVGENSFVVDGIINGGAGRKFRVELRVLPYGGSTHAEGDQLAVQGCDSVVLFLACNTDYRQAYPDYMGEDPALLCQRQLEKAEEAGYARLKAEHVADYRELYSRVSIDLNGDPALEAMPTDQRWAQQRNGTEDHGLKELLFNLGRYMIISSSRPGSLPANLQGKWNTFYVPPWTGNYQANINIQEIYWPCGPVDLLECQEPYVDWTRDLVKSGRDMAREVYGTGGWISHTIGNIWGHTAPVGGIPWGVYPLAPVWHCQHLWEQYNFSMDTVYLKEIAYPLIREACEFWMENLVPFQGHRVAAPSISAEHGARLGDGTIRYTLPSAQDAQMLRDLFGMCISASGILKADTAFRDSLKVLQEQLLPHQVGQYGQLQEWYLDVDRPDDHHRHISHLYALCPGNDIHPLRTPELANAARRSLEMRGEGRYMDEEIAAGGNWSMAWRIWCWTRLMDGDRALEVFNTMLEQQSFENLCTFQHAEYDMGRPDLFTEGDSMYLHFQLDATASTPGFMAEMVLQSHLGELFLLPALPSLWPDGQMTGLKARGGYRVDISWKNGALKKARILGNTDKLPPVRVGTGLVDPARDPRIELVHVPSR